MTSQGKWACFGTGILYFALVASGTTSPQTSASASPDKIERARIAFSHALPELDGRHLKATIVEVTYGPGESSTPHSHPCAVMGTNLMVVDVRLLIAGDPGAAQIQDRVLRVMRQVEQVSRQMQAAP